VQFAVTYSFVGHVVEQVSHFVSAYLEHGVFWNSSLTHVLHCSHSIFSVAVQFCLTNWPVWQVAQATHCAAPPSEDWPVGQAKHFSKADVAPGFSDAVPLGHWQSLHACALPAGVAKEYRPGLHCSHKLLAVFGAAPSLHSMQVSALKSVTSGHD